MKKYKIPETTCLQVQNIVALCGTSGGPAPAPGQTGVNTITMSGTAQWEV